jgi:hypothetical protein
MALPLAAYGEKALRMPSRISSLSSLSVLFLLRLVSLAERACCAIDDLYRQLQKLG